MPTVNRQNRHFRGPSCGDIFRPACVIPRVGHPGHIEDESALTGHDEIRVLTGVDGLAVVEPIDFRQGGTLRWQASETRAGKNQGRYFKLNIFVHIRRHSSVLVYVMYHVSLCRLLELHGVSHFDAGVNGLPDKMLLQV